MLDTGITRYLMPFGLVSTTPLVPTVIRSNTPMLAAGLVALVPMLRPYPVAGAATESLVRYGPRQRATSAAEYAVLRPSGSSVVAGLFVSWPMLRGKRRTSVMNCSIPVRVFTRSELTRPRSPLVIWLATDGITTDANTATRATVTNTSPSVNARLFCNPEYFIANTEMQRTRRREVSSHGFGACGECANPATVETGRLAGPSPFRGGPARPSPTTASPVRQRVVGDRCVQIGSAISAQQPQVGT